MTWAGALSVTVISCGVSVLSFVIIRSRNKIQRLQRTLIQSIERVASHPQWVPERSCVILSGGLDSSIIAEAGTKILGLKAAITVVATSGDHLLYLPVFCRL